MEYSFSREVRFSKIWTFHNLKKMSLIDTGGLYQCVPDVKNQK